MIGGALEAGDVTELGSPLADHAGFLGNGALHSVSEEPKSGGAPRPIGFIYPSEAAMTDEKQGTDLSRGTIRITEPEPQPEPDTLGGWLRMAAQLLTVGVVLVLIALATGCASVEKPAPISVRDAAELSPVTIPSYRVFTLTDGELRFYAEACDVPELDAQLPIPLYRGLAVHTSGNTMPFCYGIHPTANDRYLVVTPAGIFQVRRDRLTDRRES